MMSLITDQVTAHRWNLPFSHLVMAKLQSCTEFGCHMDTVIFLYVNIEIITSAITITYSHTKILFSLPGMALQCMMNPPE